MKRTEYIKQLIDENWDSRRKFAEHIGIPQTTLQSILERGVGKASVDNVLKICYGLGITADELQEVGKQGVNKIANNVVVYDFQKGNNQYPYIPVKISAGSPICVDCVEEPEMITIPDELLGKYAGSEDIFFMRVNGESMNKIIPHDSLIAVKNVKVEEIKNGDIVVFSNGYDYSVKLFFDVGDKIIFRPNSNDPTFTDYIIDKNNEELRLHGKVVTYIVNMD